MAAAWLVLAAVACASHSLPEPAARLAWSGCSEDERQEISRAFGRAEHLSKAVVAAVDAPENRERLSSNDWAAYRWWFGEFDAVRFAAIRRTLYATHAEFGREIAIRCGPATVNCPPPRTLRADPRRRSRDLDDYGPAFEIEREALREWKEFAYANFGIPAVQVCPDFFSESPGAQAEIVLHELTHVSSDTDDIAYGERGSLALARERPDEAARNAPSYAGFVASVVHGRMPRRHLESAPDDD